MSLARILTGFLAGVIFAFGLGIGRATLPQTIYGALDFFGVWEPRLFVFLFSAIAVYAIFRLIVALRTAPLLCDRFRLPTQGSPTARMLFGSAMFGAAWGFSGICPGPSLTSLLTSFPVAIFALSMIAGVAVYEFGFARQP